MIEDLPAVGLEQLASTSYGGYDIVQVAAGTMLDGKVGFDLVKVRAHTATEVHKHILSETVIYILAGKGVALLGEKRERVPLQEGMRLTLRRDTYHGFLTDDVPLTFVSVQVPPILDETSSASDRQLLAGDD